MNSRAGKTVSQAARQLGLSPQTLRDYEKRGVVTPYRDRSGYRRYRDEDIRQIIAYMATRKPGRPRREQRDAEAS